MKQLTCPGCGCTGDEELFDADMEWRHAMNEALALPSNCGHLVGPYLKLFRPLKRNLSAMRARKLLGEIRELICADEITFDRTSYKIPAHVWEVALQIMIDKQDLQRPIANHNYLIKVAIGQLNKRHEIEQHERSTDRRGEARTHSTGMQHVGQAVEEALENPLPKLPASEREERMEHAREEMKFKGFKKDFMSDALVEQFARETYAEEVTS